MQCCSDHRFGTWLRAYVIGTPLVVVALSAVVMLRPQWIEGAVRYYDDRWSRRVAYGESLVQSGRYRDAIDYLGKLDVHFPAQYGRHKRDKERERILTALAEAQRHVGRPREVIATCRKLVDFDARNYQNRHLLAVACLTGNRKEEAVAEFEALLAFHPTHLPSVEQLMEVHYQSGRFADTIAVWDRYLNAVVFDRIDIEAGDGKARAWLEVDGRFHDVEVALSPGTAWTGELIVRCHDFPIELGTTTTYAAQRWGQPGSQKVVMEAMPIQWTAHGMRPIGDGRFAPRDGKGWVSCKITKPQSEWNRLRMRVCFRKPVTKRGWAEVQQSYRNTLQFEQLETARQRVEIE